MYKNHYHESDVRVQKLQTKALETADQSGDGDAETLQVQNEAEVRNLDEVSEGGIFVITPSVPEVAEERRTFTESHVDTVNAEKNELSVKGKVEELKESRIVDEETEEIEEKKEAVACPDDVDIRKSEVSVPVNQTDEEALVDNKGEREKTLDSKAEDISIPENKAEVPQEPKSVPIAPYTEEILKDSDGSEDLQGIKGENIVEYPSASKKENDDTEREKPVKDSIDHDVPDKVQEPENNAHTQAEEPTTCSIRVEEQIIESIWKGEDELDQANSLNDEPQVERLQIHSDIIPGNVEDAVPSDIADKPIQEVEEENTINEQHTKEGDAILNENTSTNTMDTTQSNLKETDDVEVQNIIKQGLKEAGEDTLSAESEKIDEIPTDTHERPADDSSVPKKEEEVDTVLPTGITEKETGEPVQEAETSNLQSAELEKTEKADTTHTSIVKDEEIEEADIVQVDDKPRDVAGAHITAEPSEVDILPAESFTGEVNEQTYEEKNDVNEQTYEEKNEEEPSPTSNIEQLLQEQENKSEKKEAINEEVKDELASTSIEDSVTERTIIGGHLLTESREDVTTVSLGDEKVDSNKNETSEQFITELSQIEEGPEKCNSQDDKVEVIVPESSVNPTSENPEEVTASDDDIRISTDEQETDKVEEQGTDTKELMDKETDKAYDAPVTEEPCDVTGVHLKEGSREVDIPPLESFISEVNDEEPSPTSNAEPLLQEEETTSEIRDAINEEEEVNDEHLSDSTYDNVKKDSNIVGQEKDILSESHEEDVTDVSLDDKNEDSNKREISDQVITDITEIKEDPEINTSQNDNPELETPEISSNSSPDKPEKVSSHHVDGLTATTNEELEGKIEEQSSNTTEYKRASDTESAREAETIENYGVAESETLDKEAEVQEILSTDKILAEMQEEVTDDADKMELLEKYKDEAPAELTVTKDSSELLLPQEIKKSETSQDGEDEEKPAHADETPDIVEQVLIVTPAEYKEDEPEKCEDISVSVVEPVEIVKHIVEPDKEDHTSELKMQCVAVELPVAISDAAENVVSESVEGKITDKSDDELVVDDIIVSESQTQSQEQEEVSAQDVETSMEVASGSNPGDSANLKVSEHDPAQIDNAPEILEQIPVVTPAVIKEDAPEKDEDKSVCQSVEELVEKDEHIVETEKESTTYEREIEGVAEQLTEVSQGDTIVSVSDTAEVVTENVGGKSIEETFEESAEENATKLDELVVLEPGIQTNDAEEVPTVVEEVDETPSPDQMKNKVETLLEVVSEPDPDDSENLKQLSEPDLDDNHKLKQISEPDPDDSENLENVLKNDPDGNEKLAQPDPNDTENLEQISEPDLDDSENIEKVSQPDPVDTVIQERFSEQEPDKSENLIKDSEPDPGDSENLKNVSEPDPDDSEKLKKVSESVPHDTNIQEKFSEPDPEDSENQAKADKTITEECVEPTNKELPTDEQPIEAAALDEVSTASVVAQTDSRSIKVIPATDAAPELSVKDSGNEESPIQELRTEEKSEHTEFAGQTSQGQETVSRNFEVIPATDAAPDLSVKDSVNEESQIQELRTEEESEHTEIVGQTTQGQDTVSRNIEVIPATDAAPELSVKDSVNEESQIRELGTEEESGDTDIVDNQATQEQESDIEHIEESGSSEKVSTDQQDGAKVEIQTSEVSEELITKETEGDEEPSPPKDASARDSELDHNQGEEIEQWTSKSEDREMVATSSVNDENINVLKSKEDKQDDATVENIEAATDVLEPKDEQELKINVPNETEDTEIFTSNVCDEVKKENDQPTEVENVEEKLTADEVAEQEDGELQQEDNEPSASDLNDEDTTILKKSPEEVQEELSVENQPKDDDNVTESKILKEAIVQEDEQGDDDTNFQEKFSEPDPDDSESQNLKKVSESAPDDSENTKTDKTEIPEECVEPTNKELPIATNVEVPKKTDGQLKEAAVSDEVSTASELAQTVSHSIEVIPATDAAPELSVNDSGNVESPIQELRTEEESEHTEIAGQTTQGQETVSRSFNVTPATDAAPDLSIKHSGNEESPNQELRTEEESEHTEIAGQSTQGQETVICSFEVIPAIDAAPDLSVKHSGNEESPIQELRTEEESEHTEIAGQTTQGQETVNRSTEVIPVTDAAPDLSVKDSVNEESQIQEPRTEVESERTEIVGQTTQEQETVSHSIEVIPATDAAPELSVKDSVNEGRQIREPGTEEESEDMDIAEHTEIADQTTQVKESDIEHVEESCSSEKVSTVQHDGAKVEIQTSEVSEELITKETEGDEEPSPPTDASARDSKLDHNKGEEIENLTSKSVDKEMAATSSLNDENINVLKIEEDKQKDDATDENIEAATDVREQEDEQELKIYEPNEMKDTELFTSSVSYEVRKKNDRPKEVESVEEKLTADEVAEQEDDELQQKDNEPPASVLNDEDTTILEKSPEEVQEELSVENQPKDDDSVMESEILKEAIVQEDEQGDDTNFQEKFSEPDPDDSEKLKMVSEPVLHDTNILEKFSEPDPDDSENRAKTDKTEIPEECVEPTNKELPIAKNVEVPEKTDEQPVEAAVLDEVITASLVAHAQTISHSNEVIPATDAALELSVEDSVNEESQIQELRTEEESEHTEIVGQTTQGQETVGRSSEVISVTDAAPELSAKDPVNEESQIRELGTEEESADMDIVDNQATQVQGEESDTEHVEESGSSEKVRTVQHDCDKVEIKTCEVEEIEQLTSKPVDTEMAATSSVNDENINVLKSKEDKQDDATDENIEAATDVLEQEDEQELKICEPNVTEDTELFTSSVSDEVRKKNDQPKEVENVEENLNADEVAEQEDDELQQKENEPPASDLNDEDTPMLKKSPEEVQEELSMENQPKDDDSGMESEILKEAIVQEDEKGDDDINFQEKFSEPDPDDSENLKKVSESATDDSANQDKVEKPEAPEECDELTNKEFPVVTNVDVTDEQPKETEVSDEANASSVEEETIRRSIEVITPTNTVPGLSVEEDSSSQIPKLKTEEESELTELVNSQATQDSESDIKQVEESYSHEAVNIDELDHVNVEIQTGELSGEGGEGPSPPTDASVEGTISGESDRDNAKKEEEIENVAGNLKEDNEEILEEQHKDDVSANNKEAATKVHEPEDEEEGTENVPNKIDDTELLTSRANDEDKQEEKDQLIKEENAEEKLTPDEMDVQDEDVSQPDQIPNESKSNELSSSNLIDEDTTILEREKGREELLEELSVENQPKDDDGVMEREISKEALVQQDERGKEGVHMPSEAEDTEIPASSTDNFTALKTEEVQEEEKEKDQPAENETFKEIETATEVIVQEDNQESQLKHLQREEQEADSSAPGVNIDEIDIPENDVYPEKILELDQAKDEDGKEIETAKDVLEQESNEVQEEEKEKDQPKENETSKEIETANEVIVQEDKQEAQLKHLQSEDQEADPSAPGVNIDEIDIPENDLDPEKILEVHQAKDEDGKEIETTKEVPEQESEGVEVKHLPTESGEAQPSGEDERTTVLKSEDGPEEILHGERKIDLVKDDTEEKEYEKETPGQISDETGNLESSVSYASDKKQASLTNDEVFGEQQAQEEESKNDQTEVEENEQKEIVNEELVLEDVREEDAKDEPFASVGNDDGIITLKSEESPEDVQKTKGAEDDGETKLPENATNEALIEGIPIEKKEIDLPNKIVEPEPNASADTLVIVREVETDGAVKNQVTDDKMNTNELSVEEDKKGDELEHLENETEGIDVEESKQRSEEIGVVINEKYPSNEDAKSQESKKNLEFKEPGRVEDSEKNEDSATEGGKYTGTLEDKVETSIQEDEQTKTVDEEAAPTTEGVIKDDDIKDLNITDIKGYQLEEHSMDEANNSKTTDTAIEVNLTNMEALQVAETTSEQVEISGIPKEMPNTNVLKTGESEEANEVSMPVGCKSIEGCLDEITRKDSNVLEEMKNDTKPSSETEILRTIRGVKDEDLEYQELITPQNKISNVQGEENDNNLAIPQIEQTVKEVVLVKDTYAEEISKDEIPPVSSEIQQSTARSLDCAEVVQSENAKITETRIPSMIPAEKSLSDLLQISTKDTIQMSQQPIQETKKDNTQPEHSKTDEDKDDEEDDEGDEHKKTDSSSDGVIVEASRDMDVKSPQKKHHGILSGVGIKVKNSISKVKKAITGKSSHPKPLSPK